jgi:maleate cis-trans isomerase
MDTSASESIEKSIGYTRARVGLIIPSGNRMTEAHFRHFAPPDLGFHPARLRVTRGYKLTLPDLLDAVARTAEILSDVGADLIGFHCNATSMEHGTDGDAKILEAITKATGIAAISTAQATVDALRAVNIRRLVLLTPYDQDTNDEERHHLEQLGFDVLHDVFIGRQPGVRHYEHPPERWLELTRANLRSDADGYLMSCTNTTQIDVIEPLERELGKPVINSNQAMIWACLNRLTAKLGPVKPIAAFGRLMGKRQ